MGIRDHLSLFSGIGGLDLAAEWAGFKTVAFVERDKFCKSVLRERWSGVPIFDDVCEFKWEGESPALLSAGFPCQPHTLAGERKASVDERDLWGECARITSESRPRWAVFENVPGLLSSEQGSFFGMVIGDLAQMGYRVGWGTWAASDVGARHRRERVFVVAYSGGARSSPWVSGQEPGEEGNAGKPYDDGVQGRGPDFWSVEPGVGRLADGVPQRVDRLRALGNAVVPQQAYPIFKAIAEIEGIQA